MCVCVCVCVCVLVVQGSALVTTLSTKIENCQLPVQWV